MTNLKCDKCGRFIGHYICGTDPATGTFTLTTPPHLCIFFVARDPKGRFRRPSIIDKLKPLQYAYNIQMSQLW